MTTESKLIANGDIEPLKAGISRTEAQLILGDPDGCLKQGYIVIDKYGDIQIQYNNDKLRHLRWNVAMPFESFFPLTRTTLTQKTTVIEFLEYCDRLEVCWEIDESLTFDRQLTIRTCNAVVVVFDLDRRELSSVIVRF